MTFMPVNASLTEAVNMTPLKTVG